jgi:hypothetical protein
MAHLEVTMSTLDLNLVLDRKVVLVKHPAVVDYENQTISVVVSVNSRWKVYAKAKAEAHLTSMQEWQ